MMTIDGTEVPSSCVFTGTRKACDACAARLIRGPRDTRVSFVVLPCIPPDPQPPSREKNVQIKYTDVRIASSVHPGSVFRASVLCTRTGPDGAVTRDFMLWFGEDRVADRLGKLARRAMFDVLARGHEAQDPTIRQQGALNGHRSTD